MKSTHKEWNNQLRTRGYTRARQLASMKSTHKEWNNRTINGVLSRSARCFNEVHS